MAVAKRGASPRYRATHKISLRIPKDIHDGLKQQSINQERSVSNIIIRALRKTLDMYDN